MNRQKIPPYFFFTALPLLVVMFSNELIGSTIQYFKKKHNHSISAETAELYLQSLARLYASFSAFAKNEKQLIKPKESIML